MATAECALCRSRRAAFCCAQCASDQLQPRRTMLKALHADVAVLRTKSETALASKLQLLSAERELDDRMRKVEALAEKVMRVREKLCSERIALVERAAALDERTQLLVASQQKLKSERQRVHDWHQPVLECLDFQLQWANENAARARGEKIRELFAFFALVPEPNDEDEDPVDEFMDSSPDNSAPPGSSGGAVRRGSTRRSAPFFRTITGIPLPISGRYGNMPPEVAAAAMGKIIHLLQCLIKYLKVTYPHPMEFNGSFSTIGNTSEGAGCHTLYPDGSPGFARAVEMLHENVSFLCSTQGVPANAVHATDVLGNLLAMYQSPRLGTLCDTVAPSIPKSEPSPQTASSPAASPSSSEVLNGSIQIFPHYS